MPVIATGTPYGDKSNKPIGLSSGKASFCFPATTRFVDVPMRVTVPPRMDAKESGMSRWPGASPAFLAQDVRIGIITATMGVLFMKAERIITGITMRTMAAA